MVQKVKVYRVEDKNSYGPYRGPKRGFPSIYTDAEKHPVLDEDPGISRKDCERVWKDSSKWRFGFRSKRQFRAWFYKKDFRDRLAKVGFNLQLYLVPKTSVILGDKQAVFIVDDAVKVFDKLPIAP